MMRARKNSKIFDRKYVPPDMKNNMTDKEKEQLTNAKKRPPEIETAVTQDLRKEFEDKIKLMKLFYARVKEWSATDYPTPDKEKLNNMKKHLWLLEEDLERVSDELENRRLENFQKRQEEIALSIEIMAKENKEKSHLQSEVWDMEQVDELCILPPEKHAIIFSEIEFQTCTEFVVEKVEYETTDVIILSKEEENLLKIENIEEPPMISKNPQVEALKTEDMRKPHFNKNMKVHFCNLLSKVTFLPRSIEIVSEKIVYDFIQEPNFEKLETMQFQMPLIQYAKMIEEPKLEIAEDLHIHMTFSEDSIAFETEKELFIEEPKHELANNLQSQRTTEKVNVTSGYNYFNRTRNKDSSFSSEKIYCAKSSRSTENGWLKLPNHRKCVKKKKFVKGHLAQRMKILLGNSMNISRRKLQVLLQSEWKPNSTSTNGWTTQVMQSVLYTFPPTVDILATSRVFDRGRKEDLALKQYNRRNMES